MPSNVEIKARLRDRQRALRVSKELSGREGMILEQVDTFYIVPHGRLKLRVMGDDPFGQLISYVRRDETGPKLSEYSVATIQNHTNLNIVLTKSLGVLGQVSKKRLLFIVDQTRIHIDSVLNLGEFLELEVMMKEGQSLSEGQAIAKELMAKLGVEDGDLISGAYMDLILSK